MAITGKVAAVYVSKPGAVPVIFTDEPTTNSGDSKRFQVTDPGCRYWARDEAITVKVDGTIVTTGFALEHAGGFVVFKEAQSGPVTVSGKALSLSQAGGFFNWSLDLDADDLDATTFESGGKKEFVRGLLGWSGSAEAFWGDETFFESLGEIVAVKLFVDVGASQKCFEGFALIKGVGIEANVSEIIEQSVEWTGVGGLYPRL